MAGGGTNLWKLSKYPSLQLSVANKLEFLKMSIRKWNFLRLTFRLEATTSADIAHTWCLAHRPPQYIISHLGTPGRALRQIPATDDNRISTSGSIRRIASRCRACFILVLCTGRTKSLLWGGFRCEGRLRHLHELDIPLNTLAALHTFPLNHLSKYANKNNRPHTVDDDSFGALFNVI